MDLDFIPSLIALTPGLELRAAVAYSYLSSVSFVDGYLFPTLVSFLIIPVVYLCFNFIVTFVSERVHIVSLMLNRIRAKTKRYVDKYGLLGLALFVAIPFPGSGLYSGTLGALLLGMKGKRVVLGLALGNILSLIVVLTSIAIGTNL